jgi:pectinacetylesterase
MRLRHLVLTLGSLVACADDDVQTSESVAAITAPNISTVLSCNGFNGNVGEVPLPPTGNDLQEYEIPRSVFPDARCNDGSNAILYFRPGTGSGIHSWLIELEGGGSCGSPQECADRWCSDGTSFGRELMGTSDYLASMAASGDIGLKGTGVQSVTQGPFANYNHVFIHYCSSDGWSGTTTSIDGSAWDWRVGGLRTFSVRFNGNAILEAAIRVLRRDGATLPVFSPTGATMPNLDNATGDVVIAGGSAGGAGVIFQLDRTVAGLKDTHNKLKTMPFYAGLIDSAFPPELRSLGFQFTDECWPNGCSWEDYVNATQPYYSYLSDDSCPGYHAPFGNGYECLDLTHLIRNHVTTPFFVRQGERDSLLSKDYVTIEKFALNWGSTTSMTDGDFETLVHDQADDVFFGGWWGEEPPTMEPGAFIPDCQTHYPIHDDAAWFGTWIGRNTWATSWSNWRLGGLNAFLDDPAAPYPDSVCSCSKPNGTVLYGSGC